MYKITPNRGVTGDVQWPQMSLLHLDRSGKQTKTLVPGQSVCRDVQVMKFLQKFMVTHVISSLLSQKIKLISCTKILYIMI